MPKSQQNKPDQVFDGSDERLWKRQLEQGRLSPRAPEPAAEPVSRRGEDEGDPENWRRTLEHGRLSALAMPQSLVLAGPGAAPAAVVAAAKDEGKKAVQAIAAGAGSLEREIVKAKAIFSMRNQSMGLLRNWIACWIFLPIVMGLMITTNEKLRKTAARYKEASRTSLQVPKTPDAATKLALMNITWVLLWDWMQWTFWACLWYGLLFLVVVLISLVIQLVKCGLTLGLIC